MDDLTPSAIPPLARWEKTSEDEERRHRRHRPRPKKEEDEDGMDMEDDESHNLDELA